MPDLSERQKEVLRWACEGKTAPETAIILGSSPGAIADSLKQARVKLDAMTTAQACVLFDRMERSG